jgi:hypothetical protein
LIITPLRHYAIDTPLIIIIYYLAIIDYAIIAIIDYAIIDDIIAIDDIITPFYY